MLDTLAAAYAESGRYEETARTIRRAVEAVRGADAATLIEGLESRLKLYEARQPYRS